MTRKTVPKSFSLDRLTVEKMEYVLESHYANQLNATDLVTHAINDFCNCVMSGKCDMSDFIPQNRWG
ncbi:hypothetical protein [Methanococcoides sp. FTZ1]|uniref:hypothetical protein n=1 Tax=Methanococcoides sp. FTZ1 TaxID=3439061 RepID=UPI003F82E0FC